MKLSNLVGCLDVKRLEGSEEVNISDIAYDSRQARPGNIFVCIKGLNTDGHLYLKEAVSKGVAAVVVEEWQKLPEGITQLKVANSRVALALLSCAFFNEPTSKFKLIGVTGTNGKTTTTYLLESMFQQAGYKTGLIGTVSYKIGKQVLPVERTTPESYDLQKLFSQMVKKKVDFSSMEVSSHAIDLRRIDGCKFAGLIFTNLSREHLDYHESLDEYFAVKKKLFEAGFGEGFHVINVDDSYGKKIAADCEKRAYLYGLGKEAEVRASNVCLTSCGTNFRVSTSGCEFEISTKLRGLFNVYNLLAAASTGLALGISADVIKEGLERAGNIPGRFQAVDVGQDFSVVVDYAHTPDGLEKVLMASREITKGKMITVFGCGGDRDRSKRPLMGEVAGRLSDITIITSDNPRSEEPGSIIDQIEQGIKKIPRAKYFIMVDRKEAISYAIVQAGSDDLVLVAGKGHEKTQTFKDRVIPFDDYKIAEQILKEAIL